MLMIFLTWSVVFFLILQNTCDTTEIFQLKRKTVWLFEDINTSDLEWLIIKPLNQKSV